MYPREITTTSVWIRHELPLGPPPPPNGDEKLRKQIKSQNVQCADEMIEHYVRKERARLDLKWCLDEFFGRNVSNAFLGQLITANLFGLVHLAYIIDISPVNVTVTPADMFVNSVVIGFDDIYSAEHGPFYEISLLNHHLLHSQHVLSYIANQARNHELKQFRQNVPFNTDSVKSADEHCETTWPEGEETWFIHRELPQRNQFVTFKQSVMLTTSTFDIVEELVQEISSVVDCVSSSLIQEIDQSIEYPQCSEFFFQYVSNWINDLYYECSDINDKTVSLTLTSTSSNYSFNSCIIRSISIAIMLIAVIFVGMLFGNFGPYSFFYNDTNNPYFVSNLLFHGQNDFDWFRTLAVP